MSSVKAPAEAGKTVSKKAARLTAANLESIASGLADSVPVKIEIPVSLFVGDWLKILARNKGSIAPDEDMRVNIGHIIGDEIQLMLNGGLR